MTNDDAELFVGNGGEPIEYAAANAAGAKYCGTPSAVIAVHLLGGLFFGRTPI